MKVGELVQRLANEHPAWTNQQIADEVRRQMPGAATMPASVSSIKSNAKRARPGTSNVHHRPSLRRVDVSGRLVVLVDDDGKYLCEVGGRKRALLVFVPVSPLLECVSVDTEYVPKALKINCA